MRGVGKSEGHCTTSIHNLFCCYCSTLCLRHLNSLQEQYCSSCQFLLIHHCWMIAAEMGSTFRCFCFQRVIFMNCLIPLPSTVRINLPQALEATLKGINNQPLLFQSLQACHHPLSHIYTSYQFLRSWHSAN